MGFSFTDLAWNLAKPLVLKEVRKNVNSFFSTLDTDTKVSEAVDKLARTVQSQKKVPGEIRRLLEKQVRDMNVSSVEMLQVAVETLISRI